MNLIAEHRKQAGITQTELAKKCGWSQGRIANYETGYRTPDIDDCRQIVAALNAFFKCSLDDVFPAIDNSEVS